MVIKLIYTLFLGIMLAMFVGVGISTFYPEPESPQAPPELRGELDDPDSLEFQAAQDEYNRQQAAHEEETQDYNRVASSIILALAVGFLVLGITLANKVDVIADGILLGGIFTLLYGMGRGVAADDEAFRFIIITIGLIAGLAMGYWRFVKPAEKK